MAANESQEAFAFEFRVRRHDGQYRWVIGSGRPRTGPDGEFLGFIGSVVDVHERRLAAEALREADRRKDEFLVTLAHELRNPLAPLRSALDVLRLQDDEPAPTRRLHETMERQLEHLVRLVDDLMETSRISQGKLELQKEIVELASVAESAVETSQPLTEARGHRLTIVMPDGPLVVDADPVRLVQALANLLNNAARYTERGGDIRLSVTVDGGEAEISVKDDGIGIPPEMLPRIFELFTQVDRTYSRTHGGAGIGLTLARSLVEKHGGSLEARSEGPGRGSEFVMRLPLAEGGRETLESSRPAAAGGDSVQRIMIVDDNRDAAEILTLMLESLGAEVCSVADGPAALRELPTFRPASVVLDIGMPGMDGYEVAERMRAEPEGRDITLIALTGWGQEDDRRRSREAGIDHHLVKPAGAADLASLLGLGFSPRK